MKVEPTLSKVWQITMKLNDVTRICTWIVPVEITASRAYKQVAEFFPKYSILEVKVMEDVR